MKLQLTKTAKQELKLLNIKLEKSDWNYYNKMTKRELLIQDAMLYIEDGYTKNTFTKLDNWCKRSSGEYNDKFLKKNPNIVKQKLGKMIMEDIINIINN
jgi:hypothetical protein